MSFDKWAGRRELINNLPRFSLVNDTIFVADTAYLE